MSERFDAVVVGAGPGGSTAAYELATAGATVALIDRARFPREKPCGGGVLMSAAKRLPFSLDPVAERTIDTFRVRYRRGAEFEHRWAGALAIMTQRSRLDQYLAEQAAGMGADLRDGVGVREIELDRNSEGATLRLGNGDRLSGKVVIAADGANGIVRRALGVPRLRAAVALEGNVDRASDGGRGRRWTNAVGLELGSMPGGYGWVFPKGDHCNLGLGGVPATAPRLREELAAYARCEGFDPESLHSVRGHHLPLRDADSALAHGPALFVGDAAGLIDPLSGEGIGNAIRSGQLAASAAGDWLSGAAPDLSGYVRAVEREIEPDLAVARQLQALYHQTPWPYVQLLRRSSRFWGALCGIMQGEQSYSGWQSRIGPAKRLVAMAAGWTDSRQRGSAGWQTD